MIAGLLGCGGLNSHPATPCMSDNECRAERICHVGQCRFLEEVQRELQTALDPADPVDPVDPAQPIDPADPEPTHDNQPPSPSPSGERSTATMFMGGPAHRGRTPHRGPTRRPTVQWTHSTHARIFASPVLTADGRIYIGSLDHSLAALRAHDGTVIWRYAAADRIYSTAAVASNGNIYFGSDHGSLVALTAEGQIRWRHDLGEDVDASPTLGDDGFIYAAANGGVLV